VKTYKRLPDGTEIVEYEDSIAPAIADMWNRSGEGWGGSFGDGIYTAERVIAKRAGGAFFNVYIAMKDGEALGYCSLGRYYKDEDTAYVFLLNVRPDYHGKKIGKELVLMCVNETIARGIPRVDIHTWPGNTKSVPLYKKCGFFWEDRTDTTHLSCFIPTVLSTELLKGFFEKADWYSDSTRLIEIKPDGIKVDDFELYEYSWEKDGQNLRVGFEKSGRRINLIETNDYIIEMTAENHKLAYGVSYPCRFRVVNKTGAKLDVAIEAKSDGVISFDGRWADSVEGEACFDGTFYVGAVTEAQDPMRVHPCVLADVTVNGTRAEFGLGVEPKFPVAISLERRKQTADPGVTEEIYINIRNGLRSDAAVKFALPENPLMKFGQTLFDVRLNGGKDTMLTTSALITGCGYACLPIDYEIKPDGGGSVSMSRQLHLVTQGLSGAFGFETDECHGAANGLWRLRLSKKDNVVNFDRIVPSGSAEFDISQLGKPYDDEFNVAAPACVRTEQDGAFIRFEADFVSRKFPGAVMTEVYEFDAAGTLKQRHRVSNEGQSALELNLKSRLESNIGRRPVFHYDGDFHEVADKMNYGFESLVLEKIDENWMFDDCDGDPTGVSWPKRCNLNVRWWDVFEFEFPIGELTPGQTCETEPVFYMCGVFKNFMDFRGFALGMHDDDRPFPKNHLEIITNSFNPVLSAGALPLAVRNNRLKIQKGEVCVSSPDGLFAGEKQVNPDNLVAENAFSVTAAPDSSGVCLVDYSLKLCGFEKDVRRVLLKTDDTAIGSEELGGVLTVTNGELQFKVSPEFTGAAHSLSYRGNEWFYSRYPALEPFSWWNPFIGGLRSGLDRLGGNLVLREKITASFTSETDKLGNVWSGIRADVSVENADEYKGVRYTQYYLTLPGVPVLCHFMRLINNSGRYFDAEAFSIMFVSGKDGLSDLFAGFSAERDTQYRLQTGAGSEEEHTYDRLIRFSREGSAPRTEKLYVFKDSARDRGKNTYGFDITTASCEFHMKGRVPDGGQYTYKPIICILTEKDLTLEALTDLNRIEFP